MTMANIETKPRDIRLRQNTWYKVFQKELDSHTL